MKIPKRIKVEGAWYKIVVERPIIDKGVLCDGLTRLETKTIYIDSRLKPTSFCLTLMHELKHAIIAENNLHNKVLTHRREENLIRRIEAMLKKKFKISLK